MLSLVLLHLKKKVNKTVFIYRGSNKPSNAHEKFTDKVIKLVKQLYVLPDNIEIQFENMGDSIYGMTMLDPRFPNRIRLNQDLSIEEILLPLTHELLHLHQIYTNRLQSRSGGRILWEGQIYKVDSMKLSYEDYQNLPWEMDVTINQKKLLEFIAQNKKKLDPKYLQ